MSAGRGASPRLLRHPDTRCSAAGCSQHGMYAFGLGEIRRFCPDHRQIGADWWAGVAGSAPIDKPVLVPSVAIKQGRLL